MAIGGWFLPQFDFPPDANANNSFTLTEYALLDTSGLPCCGTKPAFVRGLSKIIGSG
jgi:hypothetical protein